MTDLGAPAARLWRSDAIYDFTRSALFDHTFQEGMVLVDETAHYLDGAGRADSKLLSRAGALAYAAHSMRLTTRLMQVASWLLVQRAVSKEEIAPEVACQETYRIPAEAEGETPQPSRSALPPALRELVERSERLYERVRHLDRRVYVETHGALGPVEQPVRAQHDRLKGAFEVHEI